MVSTVLHSMHEILRFFFAERPRIPSDRELACEMAAEDQFEALAARLVDSGWSADEVANALLSLAVRHMQTQLENATDEVRISAETENAGH